MGESEELPTGSFSAWLGQLEHALSSDDGSDVPCGECTACCRSSYFVHIAPDETATLRRVPKALLFAAPGMPTGHVVMGYDEDGRCPMLVDGGCSIYDDRPRTCRRYDCRVFAAAGLSPDDDGKPLIAERVRRWRFDHPTPDDERQHAAVRSAAVALRARDNAPRTEGDLAIAAVKEREAFIGS